MKSNKIFFAVSAFALLSGVTLAQAGTFAGTPAGQRSIDDAPPAGSFVSRGALRTEVLQARLSGQLVPAGQGAINDPSATASVLSRAEVKAATLQALRQGDRVPAGQGEIDSTLVAHQGQGLGYTVAFHRRHGEADRTN
jgi:hypothetical protein